MLDCSDSDKKLYLNIKMHKQKSTIQEEHNMQIAEAKLLTSLLQMEEISPHGSPLLFKLELLTTQIQPSLTMVSKSIFLTMIHQIALMVYVCTYRSFLVDKSLALLRTNEIPCVNLEKPVKTKEQ